MDGDIRLGNIETDSIWLNKNIVAGLTRDSRNITSSVIRDALCDLIMLMTGDNEMWNMRNLMDKQIFASTYAYRESYLFNQRWREAVTQPKFNTVTTTARCEIYSPGFHEFSIFPPYTYTITKRFQRSVHR